MKITAAFTSVTAVNGSVLMENMTALYIAAGFIGVFLAIEVIYLVLFVCRPADRKDLLKMHRSWRDR